MAIVKLTCCCAKWLSRAVVTNKIFKLDNKFVFPEITGKKGRVNKTKTGGMEMFFFIIGTFGYHNLFFPLPLIECTPVPINIGPLHMAGKVLYRFYFAKGCYLTPSLTLAYGTFSSCHYNTLNDEQKLQRC